MNPEVVPPRTAGTPPSPAAVAAAFVAGWNDHDPAAVRRLFAGDGTYVDPLLPGPLTGEAIATHVDGLVTAFPELRFAVEDVTVGSRRVIVAWRMRGTNTGPLPGVPEPTGGSCDLPGVHVVTVGPGGIASVVGYFDRQTLAEQLGMRVVLVPHDEWPMRFGTAVRTDLGNTTVPGALGMTWIDVADEEEDAEVELRAGAVVEALATEPGFIGYVGTSAGGRGHTLTAWVSPEAAEAAVARNRAHHEAADRFRTGPLGRAGFTSLWVPHRLNPQHARCPDCDRRLSAQPGEGATRCPCGGEMTITSYL